MPVENMQGHREDGDETEMRFEVSGNFKRIGSYMLGPMLNNLPMKSAPHYLARKEGTNEFFTVKALTLRTSVDKETIHDHLAKGELHTEYTLLTLLKGQKGVIQQHGLYKDMVPEEIEVDKKLVKTGNLVNRLLLVLDCFTPHDFCPSSKNLTGLQQYALNEKKLTESEVMEIFYKIVGAVQTMHQENIVHRDLKLGNITIDKRTMDIIIGNFANGKKLTSEDEMLFDQRGSPAYASPEVICAAPYLGKPLDVWSLGVILYLMLYRKFPFSAHNPDDLFAKIKSVDYQIPEKPSVSAEISELIKSILVLNPKERMTCTQVHLAVKNYLSTRGGLVSGSVLHQLVPVCVPLKLKNPKEAEVDGSISEPPTKMVKLSDRIITSSTSAVTLVRVRQGARQPGIGDIWKVHAIYESNKPAQQAAAAVVGSTNRAPQAVVAKIENAAMNSSEFAVVPLSPASVSRRCQAVARSMK